MHDLLFALVDEGYRRRLASLSFTVPRASPLRRFFGGHGFLDRSGRSEVYVHVAADYASRNAVLDGSRWHLTDADRDL